MVRESSEIARRSEPAHLGRSVSDYLTRASHPSQPAGNGAKTWQRSASLRHESSRYRSVREYLEATAQNCAGTCVPAHDGVIITARPNCLRLLIPRHRLPESAVGVIVRARSSPNDMVCLLRHAVLQYGKAPCMPTRNRGDQGTRTALSSGYWHRGCVPEPRTMNAIPRPLERSRRNFALPLLVPWGLKCGETRGAPLALACHRFPGLAWSWVCTFGESLVF